ncbi:MAG TPA: right-handed parallel beta-helix repeat-containing protein [Verrucomicrobiae bacterium]
MRNVTRTATLALLACAFLPAKAQTTRTVATYHNVGMCVEFNTAPPPSATISMSIKEDGVAGDYREIHPLSQIASNQFAGSAFGLKPDTSYAIRLVSTAFASNLVVSVRTRSEVLSQATNGVYHVAPGGDDAQDGRSQPTAFRTLRHALEVVMAGEKILLHGGRYQEGDTEVYPGSGGEAEGKPGQPITIESAPGEQAILDGTDPGFVPQWELFDQPHGVYRTASSRQPYHAYLNGGHLYHFGHLDDLRTNRWNQMSGFYADGANFYVRLPEGEPPGTNYVSIPRFTYGLSLVLVGHYQIRRLEFSHYGYERDPAGLVLDGSSSNQVESCSFHHTGTGVSLRRDAIYNTIQQCTFNEWPVDTIMWDAIKQGEPYGSEPYETGGVVISGEHGREYANVIRSNRFEHVFDGAHIFADEPPWPTANVDFHDNLVLNCGDDGIETDGLGSNCRIYNNVFSNFLTGISVAPAAPGPTYIFRNVLLRWRTVPSSESDDGRFHGYPIKLNHQMRQDPWTQWVYLYHNTCVTDQPDLDGFVFSYYWWYWTNIVSRNNIYSGTRYALVNVDLACPIDFDYDDLFTSDSSRFVYWYGTDYASLAQFTQGTAQEGHGLALDPRFLSPGNTRLRSDSPLIDCGLRIPGVNDNFLGSAPDIGAFEASSAPMALSLVYANGVVETTWTVAPGSSWQLEFSPGLVPPGWIKAGEIGQAVGEHLVLSHTNAAASGFYRLRAAEP